MMRTYPHLPLLTLEQCMQVFKESGAPTAVLANLSGFTRMQLWRWLNGRYKSRAQPASLETISWLAYKVLRAKAVGVIPAPGTAPRQLMKAWDAAVDDALFDHSLHEMTAEELLPAEWLPQTDQPRSDDAPA